MTLSEYLAKTGRTKQDIARAANLRWATVHDIAEGSSVPKPETAMRIAKACGGEVTAAELLGLVPAAPTGTDGE
jgi:DNA-binding XRE family transcriptional regulator